MLTYNELLSEMKQLPYQQRLALLEELAHSLRQELAAEPAKIKTPEELGWPPGYFEETYGSFRDEPLERGPQGEYPVRNKLL